METLFLTSADSHLSLATNALAKDIYIECRLAGMRYAFASGMDPKEVVSLAVENIANSAQYSGNAARAFAEELRAGAPAEVLEEVLTRFSRSSDSEVRRFLANWVPTCLRSNAVAVEILNRLVSDPNGAVAWAATNALKNVRRPE